jgi:hypothetical protein
MLRTHRRHRHALWQSSLLLLRVLNYMRTYTLLGASVALKAWVTASRPGSGTGRGD